ncbi:MAG TPA: diguanylate phosphodiesterase, partial [Blastococcus sp.]
MPVVTRPPAVPASEDGARPQSGRAAEYFELLLEDAGPIEYERPLVRARAAGADAAELAELERVKLLALEVREAFAVRRRRESELSALF